ncbi:MAG: leucine-rich repeat domain-containing protein [Clostridia bacterium]|nr:leucine-rich repeat domain-containing protein [Clostridia bacterium]
MKKITLTLVIISMLLCLFIATAGAAATNEFGEAEIVPGMDEKSVFGDDGRADTYTTRVVLFDGTEYHTYPAYYVFTNSVNTTTDFSQLNSLTGKYYGKTSVIRAEIPHNVHKVTGDVFNNYNDIKYVLFPDTLTEISGNMFYCAHGLEWTNVPRDCVSIGGYAFYGCSSLKTIDMSNAQSLKRTEANQFYNCPNLEELIFPEGFEYFGGGGGGGTTFQNGLGSLKTLYLPDSVTYMGSISEMKSIGTFVVPLGITTLKSNQFSYCTGLNTIVIHKDMTSIDSNAFDMTFYLSEFVYTGNIEDDVVADMRKYVSPNYGAATITIGNHCEYYYNSEHVNDTNPCVLNCTRCGSVNVPKENPVHSELASISYASFDAAGTKTVSCTNEGCKHNITTPMPALFTNLGFSAAEYSGGGMSIGFKVNKTAIEEYEKATGKTVNYGVFAVLADVIKTNDIFDADEKALEGVIAADITGTDFDIFNLKIVGFTDKQVDIDLAMGAYVKTSKGGATEYAYLQDGTPEAGAKYFFASYNDVKAIVDAKNGVSAQ